jgi:hypothetical protein
MLKAFEEFNGRSSISITITINVYLPIFENLTRRNKLQIQQQY